MLSRSRKSRRVEDEEDLTKEDAKEVREDDMDEEEE
jgi:hypothetical protein